MKKENDFIDRIALWVLSQTGTTPEAVGCVAQILQAIRLALGAWGVNGPVDGKRLRMTKISRGVYIVVYDCEILGGIKFHYTKNGNVATKTRKIEKMEELL